MPAVVLVVDVANVMGSRPDGWWRDRPGAATRLLAALGPLAGTRAPVGPDAAEVAVTRVVAVSARMPRGTWNGVRARDANSSATMWPTLWRWWA